MSDIVEERLRTHGDPRRNMARIAKVWSGILGHEVTAIEVAQCMAGLHIVRDAVAPVADRSHLEHADGYIAIADMFREEGLKAVERVKQAQERRSRESRADQSHP